jgi:hypothetical protein
LRHTFASKLIICSKGDDRLRIINGIKKLIEFSPLQEVKVKYKSRWLAPGGIRPLNLKAGLPDLASECNISGCARYDLTFLALLILSYAGLL